MPCNNCSGLDEDKGKTCRDTCDCPCHEKGVERPKGAGSLFYCPVDFCGVVIYAPPTPPGQKDTVGGSCKACGSSGVVFKRVEALHIREMFSE